MPYFEQMADNARAKLAADNHFSVYVNSFFGVSGYALAKGAGLAASTSVGSCVTMGAVSLVGGFVLYLPMILLKAGLSVLLPEELCIENGVLDSTINVAYMMGSAAVGAAILGASIQPALVCAAIGTVLCALTVLAVQYDLPERVLNSCTALCA